MDKNLVEIKNDDYFVVDMMYAGLDHNMTSRAVYQEIGLGNRAFVHQDLWAKLQQLIPYLSQSGRKLKIYDAFRPLKAHQLLFETIPYDGFFIVDAHLSPHCRGTAVDVALIGADGKELLYPTEVDAYSQYFAQEIKHGRFEEFFAYLKKASLDYQDASIKEAIKNRDDLYNLMSGIGLNSTPRRHEWWHYELDGGRTDKYPLINF